MRKTTSICVIAFAALALFSTRANAQQKLPLRLVQTIPMPDVKGRIDHMDVDVKGERLFVSGLGNNSLEVLNLRAGQWMRTIPGFQVPQGVLYLPALNKLFVASNDDGMLRVFRGTTLKLIDAVHLEPGPNRVTYDPPSGHIYVGYGGKDAGKNYGEVGIVDAKTDKHIGDIRVAAHPAEILMTRSGQTLYVAIYPANEIQVIDVAKRRVVSAWPIKSQGPGDMAFDETTHRLFVGTHNPPELIVLDSRSGKVVVTLPTVAGMDGVYFDARRKRIYVSGGRGLGSGAVYVYQQHGADRYSLIGKVPTRPGAGTSLWVPQMNRYYVAAPTNGKEDAAILVLEPQP
jgi:DNA-binding beta-propeller fold protein YncE